MAWFQAMERRGRLHLTVWILKVTKCIMLSCTKKRCDSIGRIQMLVENRSAPHVRQRVGGTFFLAWATDTAPNARATGNNSEFGRGGGDRTHIRSLGGHRLNQGGFSVVRQFPASLAKAASN